MGFKINRVYTRSGDRGETSLVDGSRVSKNHPRCETFGILDELNSVLGLSKSYLMLPKDNLLFDTIEFLQQELFDLGSEIATPSSYSYPGMWKANQSHIDHLEKLCDYFNEKLPELSSFILPGGSALASSLHIARTISRRAERSMVDLLNSDNDSISEEAFIYCNRLSDLLFILSRYVLNEEGISPPLWKKNEERTSPLRNT